MKNFIKEKLWFLVTFWFSIPPGARRGSQGSISVHISFLQILRIRQAKWKKFYKKPLFFKKQKKIKKNYKEKKKLKKLMSKFRNILNFLGIWILIFFKPQSFSNTFLPLLNFYEKKWIFLYFSIDKKNLKILKVCFFDFKCVFDQISSTKMKFVPFFILYTFFS